MFSRFARFGHFFCGQLSTFGALFRGLCLLLRFPLGDHLVQVVYGAGKGEVPDAFDAAYAPQAQD